MTQLFVANDNDIVIEGLQLASDSSYINDATLVFTLGDKTLTGTISAATNATPIVITSATHGLSTSDRVLVVGVVGNEAANGSWTITKVDANSFSLDTSVGDGTYVTGGNWYEIVTGADEVSVSYVGGSNGNYRGVMPGTVDLVPDRLYRLVITCSNYNLRWEKDYYARTRQ